MAISTQFTTESRREAVSTVKNVIRILQNIMPRRIALVRHFSLNYSPITVGVFALCSKEWLPV